MTEYLTDVAAERLEHIGLRPHVMRCDATGPLPGCYDRIVSTVAVRPIPASWLAALRPGGRLVTTIADTALIVTADKTDDGGAIGRTEWDRAGFMHTRAGADYPPGLGEAFTAAREADGDQVSTGHYPVVNVVQAWELWSMLGVVAPGIEHHYQEDDDGRRTAWLLHQDGSWASSSPVRTATRRRSIRAGRAGCGTSWMTSVTRGYRTARYRSTEPLSPSPQTASAI